MKQQRKSVPDSASKRSQDSAADPVESATAGAGEATGDDGTGSDSSPVEIGGRDGPDPTRYGDWEKNGRCIDF